MPSAKRARASCRESPEDPLASHYREAEKSLVLGPAHFPAPKALAGLVSRVARPRVSPLLEQACIDMWLLGQTRVLLSSTVDCSDVVVDRVVVGWNFIDVGFQRVRTVSPVEHSGSSSVSRLYVANLDAPDFGPVLADAVLLLLLAARRAGLVVSGLDVASLPIFAGHFERDSIRVMFRIRAGLYLSRPPWYSAVADA